MKRRQKSSFWMFRLSVQVEWLWALVLLMWPFPALAQQPMDLLTRGALVAHKRATLAAPMTGFIVGLEVDIGDDAQENRILVRFDCREYEATLSVRRADADIAAVELASQQELHRQNAARVVSFRKAQIDHRRAEAIVRLAELAVERCVVVAPFDGVVVARHVEDHDWVFQGEELISIIDGSAFDVRLVAPVSQFSSIIKDREFLLTLDEDPHTVLRGVVDSISRRVDPVAQLVEARGRLLSPVLESLAEGMSGIVVFSALP